MTYTDDNSSGQKSDTAFRYWQAERRAGVAFSPGPKTGLKDLLKSRDFSLNELANPVFGEINARHADTQ